MKYVDVCATLGERYRYALPGWADGLVLSRAKGRGNARNLGAKEAIEKYSLTNHDVLIFLDDDAEIPAGSLPPSSDAAISVPIYRPCWEGWENDYPAAFPITLTNCLNATGSGPITVGSCIVCKVGVWKISTGFQTDDILEDTMFGLGTRIAGFRYSMWMTAVLIHRRYTNDWMETLSRRSE